MSGADGSLQGLNLFVYCFNNPVNMTDAQGNWPKWVEDAWSWVEDAYKWTSDTVSTTIESAIEVVSNIDFTYSFGTSVSVSLGIISASYTPVWSIDDDGNVALQHTVSWGITTGAGFGASFGSARMLTNAPSVNNLLGGAGIIGTSLFVPVNNIPVGGSADLNFIPDSKTGKTYFGLSTFAGISTSPGGSIYGGYSETFDGGVGFNVFDIIHNIFRD